MADADANTPEDGTGTLSMDEAVDALLKPLPPRQPRDTRERTALNGEELSPEDDDSAAPTADTDDDDGALPPEQDADPETDTPQPQTEPQYEVSIDGKKSSIPVSELVKGYQRQAVFTQRSQSLADERRTFETERDAVSKERSQYSRLLTALKAQTEGDGQEPDWDALRRDDPVRYSIEWAEWGQRQRKLHAIAAEQRRVAEAEAEDASKALRLHAQAQFDALLEKVPEYRDQNVRLKDRDAIRSFAVSTYGFQEDEINSLIDHRAIMVLRDARAYRALKGKAPLVEKRVISQDAPLSRNRGQPAGPQVVRVKAAEQRLNRTGKLQDAVELELARSRQRRPDGNGSGGS
jgi:hypothetical protein